MVFRRWEKSKQPAPELTLERLKSVLEYNPITGRFTYTGNRPKNVKGSFAHRKGHPERYIHLTIDGKCYSALA